jgi:hypothetical protein
MTFRCWFTPAAAALAVGGLGWALWSRRSAIEAFDWHFSWPAIVAAAALFALSPLIQALSFRILPRGARRSSPVPVGDGGLDAVVPPAVRTDGRHGPRIPAP